MHTAPGGGASQARRQFFSSRQGRHGQSFADAVKPLLRAAAGVPVCLALALAPASAGERLAALSPSAVNPDAGASLQNSYERFGRFAQGSTPSFVAREIYGDPANPIPFTIKLPGNTLNQYKFVMIFGLPDDFKMSSGFKTKNAWLVSAREIDLLKILPTKDFAGRLTLRVSLVADGDRVEEQSVAVTIRSNADTRPRSPGPDVRSTAAINTGLPPEAPAPLPPAKLVSESDEAAALQRAAEFLANADIAAVRLIYETLAMKGSARAAFAMGQTYDPDFLIDQRIEGLQPDIETARRWYKKALALGSQDAKARLANLDRR